MRKWVGGSRRKIEDDISLIRLSVLDHYFHFSQSFHAIFTKIVKICIGSKVVFSSSVRFRNLLSIGKDSLTRKFFYCRGGEGGVLSKKTVPVLSEYGLR